MDRGKENDGILFQRITSSDASRNQGVKTLLNQPTKTAESTKRKPLGIKNVQNSNDAAKNGEKTKPQKSLKLQDSNCKKPMKLSTPLPTVVKDQPSRFTGDNTGPTGANTGPTGANTGPTKADGTAPTKAYDDDEIEYMDRQPEFPDDFSDICAVAKQPATYANDLLHWYPGKWSGRQVESPISECSVSPASPDWTKKNCWLTELMPELPLPDLQMSDDFEDHF